MTATQDLVDWAWSLKPDDLPDEVHHSVRRNLIDGYGCALAASRLHLASAATKVAAGHVGSVAHEGLAWGALVHALDFDDTHPVALVHTTATVLPTLLAVGREIDSTPDELAVAAVAGYELVVRLGGSVPHGFHARGFHATSVCGVFASALIASRLKGLSPDQAVDALGIAGSLAAGSMEYLDAGSDTKILHPGLAALSGITASELAAAGASGPGSILDGRFGLFSAYLQSGAVPTLNDLGINWEVTHVDSKAYPCCHLSHATIAALQHIPTGLATSDITSVVVDLPAASVPIVGEPRSTKLHPRSGYDAKFSLPWTAAVAILDGEVNVDTFADVTRSDARQLAERVVINAIDYEAAPATAEGRVRIDTGGGKSLILTSSNDGVMSDADLLAKFAANAADPVANHFAVDALANGWSTP